MDQSSISSINKYFILESLYYNGNKSKAELAKQLNLSKPAVADNVSNLIALGIINEIGEGKASKVGGRKPIILEFNKEYCYIVTVDLSLEDPICAIGNLKCELLCENVIHIRKKSTKEDYLNAVVESIDSLIKQLSLTKENIGRIVISSPGIVGEDGEYFFSNPQHLKWTGIGLKEYLTINYDVPVLIKNDVNLAVIAEMEIGTGKEYDNIMYISCGLGLGSGIVLNRKIYEGRNFAAGEIGYFIQNEDLVNGKTLEEEIKINTILNKVSNDIKEGQDTLITKFIEEDEELEYRHLVLAYNHGDQYVKDILYSIGLKLGIAVSNIVSLLDLDIVIFGGAYTDCSEELLKAVNDVMENSRLFNPVITTSKLQPNGSIYGSFVIGSEHVIKFISK